MIVNANKKVDLLNGYFLINHHHYKLTEIANDIRETCQKFNAIVHQMSNIVTTSCSTNIGESYFSCIIIYKLLDNNELLKDIIPN